MLCPAELCRSGMLLQNSRGHIIPPSRSRNCGHMLYLAELCRSGMLLQNSREYIRNMRASEFQGIYSEYACFRNAYKIMLRVCCFCTEICFHHLCFYCLWQLLLGHSHQITVNVVVKGGLAQLLVMRSTFTIVHWNYDVIVEGV